MQRARWVLSVAVVSAMWFGGGPRAAQAFMTSDELRAALMRGDSGTTRGVRAPSKPGQAPAAAAPAPAYVDLGDITFEWNSDTLTPQAIKQLDALGPVLKADGLAQTRFRIEGHTDTTGSPAYNMALSKRRADAVVAYLGSHYGVDPSRLVAVGKGQSEPLVATGDNVPEERNRRVRVVNLGP